MSRITWINKTDSTNNEARRRFSRLDNLSVIATRCQTQGHGQGDHSWFSTPGKNLTFSLVMKYDRNLLAVDGILITCFITLAIRDYLLSKGIESRVKWPNDIWVGDKKICGILIENTLEGVHISESIIGVGLNLNQKEWPSDLPNPISVRNIKSRKYPVRAQLRKLYRNIRRRCLQMDSADGRQKLQEEFEKVVFRLS